MYQAFHQVTVIPAAPYPGPWPKILIQVTTEFFFCSYKIVVGITSRSSEKDLQWLMDFIRQTFSEYVSHVKYLPITNSNTVDWEKEVRGCSVGILYHTKRQGRINIVDVDGALYDEELESLSHNLGNGETLTLGTHDPR